MTYPEEYVPGNQVFGHAAFFDDPSVFPQPALLLPSATLSYSNPTLFETGCIPSRFTPASPSIFLPLPAHVVLLIPNTLLGALAPPVR